MRYLVRRSYVTILGQLWMPSCDASLRKDLSSYDIENIRAQANDGQTIDREAVDQWLTTNSGDFSRVIDFEASIEDGEQTIDIPWSSEENECRYLDTLPDEE